VGGIAMMHARGTAGRIGRPAWRPCERSSDDLNSTPSTKSSEVVLGNIKRYLRLSRCTPIVGGKVNTQPGLRP
jgi:hypothetical protein